MPANTPLGNYPYPVGTDPINPAVDIQNLATAIDGDKGIMRYFPSQTAVEAWAAQDGQQAMAMDSGARFMRAAGQWFSDDVWYLGHYNGEAQAIGPTPAWPTAVGGGSNLTVTMWPGPWIVIYTADVSTNPGFGYFIADAAGYPGGGIGGIPMGVNTVYENSTGPSRFAFTAMSLMDVPPNGGVDLTYSWLLSTYGASVTVNAQSVAAVKIGMARPSTYRGQSIPEDSPGPVVTQPDPPGVSLDARVAELEEFNAALLEALGSLSPAAAMSVKTQLAKPKGGKAK